MKDRIESALELMDAICKDTDLFMRIELERGGFRVRASRGDHHAEFAATLDEVSASMLNTLELCVVSAALQANKSYMKYATSVGSDLSLEDKITEAVKKFKAAP